MNGLAGKALTFLNDAQSYDGRCRNRMDSAGRWQDLPSTEDHWGRMVWALGTAAAHSEVGLVRRLATVQFERAAQTRSPHPRARAFAAIGAAELLSVAPGHTAARELLTGYVATLPDTAPDPEWPWPEPRLEYANAVLAEAMIAAGVALDDAALLDRGLDLLDWLLDLETRTVICRRRRSPGEAPATSVPDSTSSRSRWPAWPMRAPGGGRRRAAGLARGSADGGRVVRRRQRPGASHVGFRHRRRLRRSARRPGEPEPGRRVHPGGAVDDAAGAALLACPTMTSTRAGLATRSPQRLAADSRRVITRLFVPGLEGFELQESRANQVLQRILALSDDEVRDALHDIATRFAGRHRDLHATFGRHADELADRLDPDRRLTESRMMLLGATFTNEYAIEGRRCATRASSPTPIRQAHPREAFGS